MSVCPVMDVCRAEDDRRNGSDRHQGMKPSVQSEEKSRSITFTQSELPLHIAPQRPVPTYVLIPIPILANKTETLLSLWTNTAKKNASGKHVEFVGRKKYGDKSQ